MLGSLTRHIDAWVSRARPSELLRADTYWQVRLWLLT